uniref:Uncharacterized protein n=4 Tax=Nymphaea colorata TaxID=210225 RepID=A0A5K1BTL1_9MAGN
MAFVSSKPHRSESEA